MFRLAFCKTEEQRLWFIKNECELFTKRLIHYEEASIKKIVDYLNGLGRSLEKIIINSSNKEEWKNCTACIKDKDKRSKVDELYKVPFESACILLSSRKYFLKEGYLYLPKIELPACIELIYRDKLTDVLNYTLSREADVASDPRVSKLLTKLRGWQATSGYSSWKGKIDGKVDIEELDNLSKRFYPPCAKVLHGGLKANSHLKHDGRMQYGLFLKGIGLSLEESINFWRMEFTKKITTDVFNKKYLYNIRHNYGSEGKRADYTPWSCTKILNITPPTEGQYHGCPFKVFSADKLYHLLKTYGVNETDMKIIMNAKETFQYELGCLKLFEALNPGCPNGNSPHAFFVESYNFYRNKQKAEKYKKMEISTAPKTNDIEDIH